MGSDTELGARGQGLGDCRRRKCYTVFRKPQVAVILALKIPVQCTIPRGIKAMNKNSFVYKRRFETRELLTLAD